MKKFIVLFLILFITGCGVTQQGSDSSSSSPSGPSTPSIQYKFFTGLLLDASNIPFAGFNMTVDANDWEQIYHEEQFTWPSIVAQWKQDTAYSSGQGFMNYCTWVTSSNEWTPPIATTFDVVKNADGKKSQFIWYAGNGSYDHVYNFTYPGYSGTGLVTTMSVEQIYYNGLDNTVVSTSNFTTVREYSGDLMSVTENQYTNGVLDCKFVFQIL